MPAQAATIDMGGCPTRPHRGSGGQRDSKVSDIRVPSAPSAEEHRPHRPKASSDWTPRLIAPVEGSAPAPAAPAATTAAPAAPRKPSDDFVPRLIAPAPATTESSDDNSHENHTP